MAAVRAFLRRWSPIELIGGWWVRQPKWVKALVCVALLVGAVALPQNVALKWQAILFFPVGLYILLALGLNIVVGQAGLLDLGYVAFYAVGAYSTAKLTTTSHYDIWVVLPLAIAIANGTQDNQAHGVLKNLSGPTWFHGLSGLVSNATVYAPTA